jgi:hypothetical protein
VTTYQTVKLSAGRHRSPVFGVCVMELASMLAEEPFSDRPATTSPVIGAFLRTYNDGLDEASRQDLYALASLIVGTAGGRRLERERASRCLAFARELGAGIPHGRAAMAMDTAEASGTWAAQAALRAGAHSRALAFARELAEMSRDRARRRTRLPGRDPAKAVEQAMARVEACGV